MSDSLSSSTSAPGNATTPDQVHDDVLRAVYGLFDPLTGGPDGTGWPFGRSVQSHEVHAALARIPGVDMAQEVSVALFPADADTGRRESSGAAARPATHRPRVLLRAPGAGAPMRAGIAGLASPHELVRPSRASTRNTRSPRSFVGALDDVLAPVLSALDNLPAYLDVSTTPDDLLPWLACWLGMSLDPGQATDRQREVLRLASQLHGLQGTRRGIELAVEAVFGVEATVQETGAADWSLEEGAPLPGEPFQAFVLQVSAPGGSGVGREATRRAGLLHEARARRAPGRDTPGTRRLSA